MYRFSPEKRTAVLTALSEGASIRATCRMAGVAKGTVLKLIPEIGELCTAFHHERVRDVSARLIQCDEAWSFVGKKERVIEKGKPRPAGVGDIWTWVALGAYLPGVEEAFCWNGADYARVAKTYSATSRPQARYAPPIVTAVRKEWVMGQPVEKDGCTSHVERLNLDLRMRSRRFTRLTNAFSKKAENHAHSVALHFWAYNWSRPHGTLTKKAGGIHTTPAMAAGLAARPLKVAELVELLVETEQAPS